MPPESLSHFSTHLSTLATTPHVTLEIYVTNAASSITSLISSPSLSKVSNENCSFLIPVRGTPILSSPNLIPKDGEKDDTLFDVEKDAPLSQRSATLSSPKIAGEVKVHAGRPDIPNLINGVLKSAETYEKVIVAACGPISMLHSVRHTVREILKTGEGPSVEMCLETFGW
jgi:hypothetical protein